jgi:hypothetical protein
VIDTYLNYVKILDKFDQSPLYPASGYNDQGRGYPDLSIVAVDYEFIVNGAQIQFDGTGLGMPAFAAWLSIVNSKRMALGQTSVGYINPTIYSRATNTSIPFPFNDISEGSNYCIAQQSVGQNIHCCSNSSSLNDRQAGFWATTGWCV